MSRYTADGPILVTGGTGQLARALDGAAAGRPMLRLGRPQFDFDRPDGLHLLLREVAPTLVVNAAAYTAVDKAESEPDAAARANRDGPALLAGWCAEAGVGARTLDVGKNCVKLTGEDARPPFSYLAETDRSFRISSTAAIAVSSSSSLL